MNSKISAQLLSLLVTLVSHAGAETDESAIESRVSSQPATEPDEPAAPEEDESHTRPATDENNVLVASIAVDPDTARRVLAELNVADFHPEPVSIGEPVEPSALLPLAVEKGAGAVVMLLDEGEAIQIWVADVVTNKIVGRRVSHEDSDADLIALSVVELLRASRLRFEGQAPAAPAEPPRTEPAPVDPLPPPPPPPTIGVLDAGLYAGIAGDRSGPGLTAQGLAQVGWHSPAGPGTRVTVGLAPPRQFTRNEASATITTAFVSILGVYRLKTRAGQSTFGLGLEAVTASSRGLETPTGDTRRDTVWFPAGVFMAEHGWPMGPWVISGLARLSLAWGSPRIRFHEEDVASLYQPHLFFGLGVSREFLLIAK